jgi:hypothetical protein
MFTKLFFLGFFGSIIGMGIAIFLGVLVTPRLGPGWGIATVVTVSSMGIMGIMALGKRIAIPKRFR